MPEHRAGRKGRLGLALMGAALALGCAAQPPSTTTPLHLELERSRLENTEQRVRLRELEARLRELEQRPRETAASWRIADKLDRLLALQELLLSRLEQMPEHYPVPGSDATPATPASLEADLQRILERLRNQPWDWRGGLSRQKREALRV